MHFRHLGLSTAAQLNHKQHTQNVALTVLCKHLVRKYNARQQNRRRRATGVSTIRVAPPPRSLLCHSLLCT